MNDWSGDICRMIIWVAFWFLFFGGIDWMKADECPAEHATGEMRYNRGEGRDPRLFFTTGGITMLAITNEHFLTIKNLYTHLREDARYSHLAYPFIRDGEVYHAFGEEVCRKLREKCDLGGKEGDEHFHFWEEHRNLIEGAMMFKGRWAYFDLALMENTYGSRECVIYTHADCGNRLYYTAESSGPSYHLERAKKYANCHEAQADIDEWGSSNDWRIELLGDDEHD